MVRHVVVGTAGHIDHGKTALVKALTGVDTDRWAEERQYLRNDADEAVDAFRKRRAETLAFFKQLGAADWERAGTHATRGKLTVDWFVALMAWHDDNHLDQLRRALAGRA